MCLAIEFYHSLIHNFAVSVRLPILRSECALNSSKLCMSFGENGRILVRWFAAADAGLRRGGGGGDGG